MGDLIALPRVGACDEKMESTESAIKSERLPMHYTPGLKLSGMENLLRHFTGAASVPWLLQLGTSHVHHVRTEREAAE